MHLEVAISLERESSCNSLCNLPWVCFNMSISFGMCRSFHSGFWLFCRSNHTHPTIIEQALWTDFNNLLLSFSCNSNTI